MTLNTLRMVNHRPWGWGKSTDLHCGDPEGVQALLVQLQVQTQLQAQAGSQGQEGYPVLEVLPHTAVAPPDTTRDA
jgi:hypothetical protein